MSTDIEYSIGIDLGDAESSIAYVSVEGEDKPWMFELEHGESSIPTAVATVRTRNLPTTKILIGSEAFLEDGVQQLDLSFKYRPSFSEDDWQSLSHWIQLFAKGFYRRFAAAYPEIAKHARIYIGVPSSWSKEDIKRYRDLFPPSFFGVMPEVERICDIEIVPESRSAFIHVRDYYIDIENQQDSILIMDVGSSTTDFTYVENLEARELSIGSDFGTRLIDQLIYEQIVNQYSDIIALKKHLNEQESTYLQYLCRKAKEQYFTREKKKPQTAVVAFQEMIELFWPLLQNFDMEAILRRPINNYASGWKVGFKDLLIQAQVEYKREYGEQLTPKLLVLTGGGSRMPFIQEICQEVLNLQAKNINLDPQPFFSVARGLADFGRWRYRVEQFRKAIEEFCKSEALEQEIRRHIYSFGMAVKRVLYEGSIDGVWRPMAYELREGTLSSDEIGNFRSFFNQRVSQWLNTSEGLKAQEEVINDFIRRLDPYLKSKTNQIGIRFNIKPNDLRLSLRLRYEDFFDIEDATAEILVILNYKALELIIKGTDYVIPVLVRKMVPKWIVDLALNWEKEGRSTLVPLIQQTELSLRVRDMFVDEVLKQIKEQFEERAQNVEKFLH
jgi:Hsp70 protein